MKYKITINDKDIISVEGVGAAIIMVGERLDRGISKILIEEVQDEKDDKRGYCGEFSDW